MNNLQSIKLELNNGWTFACSETLKPFHTGVIVTKHNVIPAKYNAKVVYWLNSSEQTALFIPRHRLTPSSALTTRVPVTIWALQPDGSERLCGEGKDVVINIQLDRKLCVEGDISPNALGISVVRYNNRFYAQELYSTVTKPGWHGNEIRLSHQHYKEETKMQDLTAVLFGDELHAVTVQFNNSDKRYTYKSVQAVEVGALVVVDTPSNGYQVVRVVACKKGLDKSAPFEMYKWLVDVVNEAEYRRLIDVEKDFVRKAKEEQAKQAAIRKLQELGVSADEYRNVILGTAE